MRMGVVQEFIMVINECIFLSGQLVSVYSLVGDKMVLYT